jgi:hypothetical protein
MNPLIRLITATSTLVVLAACSIALAPALSAAQSPAQQPGPAPGKSSFTYVGTPGGDTMFFASSEMGVDMTPVKGAPYSAQGVMTFTQTLSDGTKISRQTNYTVYRDSEGRTRREETVGGAGGAGSHQIIFINDPTGINYVLDQDSHAAVKMPSFHVGSLSGVTAKGQTIMVDVNGDSKGQAMTVNVAGDSKTSAVTVGPPPPPPPPPPAGGEFATFVAIRPDKGGTDAEATTESLGTQSFDGVSADGTRTTSTIAAGAIGNDRPIQVFSERWYSSDLHIVVMSKQSDPRMGETVYQVSNINRAEPAASLFELPSDYTVSESSPSTRQVFKYKKN